jgi:hypothetical protein
MPLFSGPQTIFREIAMQNHMSNRSTHRRLFDEYIALKSSTETEATLMFVDDHALLNHATTGSGRDMTTFPAGPIRSRSARLARNSANIQHAPIADRL